MDNNYFFCLAVTILVILGCYHDIKTKIIPLWCTVSIFLLGIISHILNEGLIGFGFAILGGICLLFIYLILMNRFAIKLGGGDIKLIIAIGTFVGINQLAILVPIQFFVSGIMELINFAILKKAYTPKKYVKEFWNRLTLERYKIAEPITHIYGPFIGLPFITYLIITVTGVV